jgi:hypothetical protein
VPAGETPANFLSRNLMDDFADSGCAITTRVSHAFSSLQVLLTTLRLGEPLELLPRAVLIDQASYDPAWQWIGSYATWRAAVLVFLYPEVVAVPGLRPIGNQTPAFRDLVRKSSGTRRVSPEVACQLAKEYVDYRWTRGRACRAAGAASSATGATWSCPRIPGSPRLRRLTTSRPPCSRPTGRVSRRGWRSRAARPCASGR